MDNNERRDIFAAGHGTIDAGHVRNGDRVRIKRGVCGEGYRFTISTIGLGGLGETIVYGDGDTYGPVRASEVEPAP